MPRVLVAIRFPAELKKSIDEACAKREVTIASFVVNACWGELEEPNGTRVISTPSVDPSSNVNETEAELVGKPDRQALLDICAGKGIAAQSTASVEAERPHCAYTEYDEQSGETYGCALYQHSAKVKHVRGPCTR